MSICHDCVLFMSMHYYSITHRTEKRKRIYKLRYATYSALISSKHFFFFFDKIIQACPLKKTCQCYWLLYKACASLILKVTLSAQIRNGSTVQFLGNSVCESSQNIFSNGHQVNLPIYLYIFRCFADYTIMGFSCDTTWSWHLLEAATCFLMTISPIL